MTLKYRVVRSGGESSVDNLNSLEEAYTHMESMKSFSFNHVGKSISIYSYTELGVDEKLIDVIYFQMEKQEKFVESECKWLPLTSLSTIFYRLKHHYSMTDDFFFTIQDTFALNGMRGDNEVLLTSDPEWTRFVDFVNIDSAYSSSTYNKEGYYYSSIEMLGKYLHEVVHTRIQRAKEQIRFLNVLLVDLKLNPYDFLKKRTLIGDYFYHEGNEGVNLIGVALLFNGTNFYVDGIHENLTVNRNENMRISLGYRTESRKYFPKSYLDKFNSDGVIMTQIENSFAEYMLIVNKSIISSENQFLLILKNYMDMLSQEIIKTISMIERQSEKLQHYNHLSLVDFQQSLVFQE